jgi:hypothetical protein
MEVEWSDTPPRTPLRDFWRRSRKAIGYPPAKRGERRLPEFPEEDMELPFAVREWRPVCRMPRHRDEPLLVGVQHLESDWLDRIPNDVERVRAAYGGAPRQRMDAALEEAALVAHVKRARRELELMRIEAAAERAKRAKRRAAR